MHWLIVEDALRDKKGHWFEYVSTFVAGLHQLGDTATVLAARDAQPLIIKSLDAQPVLPRSIWHRMNDDSGPVRRLVRIPAHSLATHRAMKQYFKQHGYPDLIFVPTISVHHLAAWWRLLSGSLRHEKTLVLLYFVETPILFDVVTGCAVLRPNVTAHLFRYLIRMLKPAIDGGRVVLAAETQEMSRGLQQVTGIPFVYLPQPVRPLVGARDLPSAEGIIRMASYGGARHEKGSDILQSAIARYLRERPQTRVQFILQWIDDFRDEHGVLITKDAALMNDPRVTYIGNYFIQDDYGRWLERTGVMLLPYRKSYALRGSRVALEAMVHGIPVVATRGTTLEGQTAQFGASVLCEDGSVESLCEAIRCAEDNCASLREKASARAASAAEYFSMANFRSMLLAKFSQ